MFAILALPIGIPPIYYHGINFWFEIASISGFIFIGIMLLIQKHDELAISKDVKIGYALFSFFFAACRIFFIFAVWLPNESWNVDSYNFFNVIGYLSSQIGFTSLIFVVEKYLVAKTHRLFSIVGIIGCSFFTLTVLVMIYPTTILQFVGRSLALLLDNVVSPLLTAVIVSLFLYLAVKTTLRRIAILTILGIAFMGTPAILDGEALVKDAAMIIPDQISLDVWYAIPPAIMLAGCLIFLKTSMLISPAMVDFYTNKHVCIVHKGEIKGKVYMCSSCNAYYCTTCKEAIEQIDKCCWNCKTPFDQSAGANTATLSRVEPSTENSGPVLVKEGQEEPLGNKPGKIASKGVVAGQELDKASKTVPFKK